MRESFLDFSLRRRKRPWLWVLILLLITLTAWLVVPLWREHQEWYAAYTRVGPAPSSGGKYFSPPLELNKVPLFQQGDERWRDDKLGPTDASLAAEGCALASAAMVLASYGYDTDPKRLNEFLNSVDGYTPEGWIYWEKAAEIANGKVRHAYEAEPSLKLIDDNLSRGNPVIVKIKLASGTNHFVVIAGKNGYDYLIRDPGGSGAQGLYPLKNIAPQIEGLRFYEQVPPAAVN
jgi:hypothetical protein